MKKINKGFSIAEALIVFLIVSIMLAAYAPNMTKKQMANKKDQGCTNGARQQQVIYQYPGNYTFTPPQNIIGNATIYLVGAGGKGADYINNLTGGGGGGGAVRKVDIMLQGGTSYNLIVGSGGYSTTSPTASSIAVNSTTYSANAGSNATTNTGANGGICASDENCYSGENGSGSIGGVINSTLLNTINLSTIGAESGCNSESLSSCKNGKNGSDFTKSPYGKLGFIAGGGGGGGGKDATGTGKGGRGGNGAVIIMYSTGCN